MDDVVISLYSRLNHFLFSSETDKCSLFICSDWKEVVEKEGRSEIVQFRWMQEDGFIVMMLVAGETEKTDNGVPFNPIYIEMHDIMKKASHRIDRNICVILLLRIMIIQANDDEEQKDLLSVVLTDAIIRGKFEYPNPYDIMWMAVFLDETPWEKTENSLTKKFDWEHKDDYVVAVSSFGIRLMMNGKVCKYWQGEIAERIWEYIS